MYKKYLDWHYKELTGEEFDAIEKAYDTSFDSDLVSLYESYAHLTTESSLIVIQSIGHEATVEPSKKKRVGDSCMSDCSD